MYSTIVYDLDGTLIDSAATVAGLLNDLRAERTLLPLAREDLTPWLSVGGKTMVAAALNIAKDEAQAYLDMFRARYLALPTNPATLYPDVHKTLSTLKSRGIRLGLCTNKPRQLTEKILAETGLNIYFNAVCAGLDLPTSKPHPDNLHACLNGLGCSPDETLVVGDSCVDQAIAKACGTGFVFFSGGYDDGVSQENRTLTIQHHAEIFNLIQFQ